MAIPSITEARQYLTFRLGDGVFAVDVAKVREILEVTAVTTVPMAPQYVYGVINLRGSVVPVIDLRLKFGMSGTVRTISTCIVVVETEVEGEPTVAGALTDAVQEVFELDPEQIEPPPRMGMGVRSDFIIGMARHNDGFLMILDIDRVFNSDGAALLPVFMADEAIAVPAEEAAV